MNLSDLRPTEPTELGLLSDCLRSGNARSAVPSALPEHFLISIARDLRMLEEHEESDEAAIYLAAPLMLVFTLQTSTKKRNTDFTISESAVYRSLHVYQGAVEREIVNRVVGVRGPNDETKLLKRLEEARKSADG